MSDFLRIHGGPIAAALVAFVALCWAMLRGGDGAGGG